MDRRSFLKATGTVAVAAGVSAAPSTTSRAHAVEPPRYRPGARIIAVAVNPEDSAPGPAISCARMASRLAEASDGLIGLETRDFTASPAAMLSQHETEAALVTGSDGAVHPAFAVFAGWPGRVALPAERALSWLAVGGGQMLWDDLAAGFGLKPLLAGHAGARPALWLASSEAPDTLSGLRVGARGVAADVLARAGAIPVPLSANEYAAALADGRVDAVEAAPLTALALGLPGVARAVLADGLHPAGTASTLLLRLDVWEGLRASERALIELVACEETRNALAEHEAHAAVLSRVMAEAAVVAVTWRDEVRASLDVASERAIERIAGLDDQSNRIVASYRALAGDATFSA